MKYPIRRLIKEANSLDHWLQHWVEEIRQRKAEAEAKQHLCGFGTHEWYLLYRPRHWGEALKDEAGLIEGQQPYRWLQAHQIEVFHQFQCWAKRCAITSCFSNVRAPHPVFEQMLQAQMLRLKSVRPSRAAWIVARVPRRAATHAIERTEAANQDPAIAMVGHSTGLFHLPLNHIALL